MHQVPTHPPLCPAGPERPCEASPAMGVLGQPPHRPADETDSPRWFCCRRSSAPSVAVKQGDTLVHGPIFEGAIFIYNHTRVGKLCSEPEHTTQGLVRGPRQEPARRRASASTHAQEEPGHCCPPSPQRPVSLPSCSRLPRLRARPLLPPPAPAAPRAGPAVQAQLRLSSQGADPCCRGNSLGSESSSGRPGAPEFGPRRSHQV